VELFVEGESRDAVLICDINALLALEIRMIDVSKEKVALANREAIAGLERKPVEEERMDGETEEAPLAMDTGCD